MADAFDQIWQRLATIDLFGAAGDALPAAADLPQAVIAGGVQMPHVYQATYVQPLETNMPRMLAAIADSASTVETVTGAVYQHQAGDPMRAPLNRFLAVISNLYRSFLDDNKRANAGVALTETLPPLAMFQNDGSSGPFTIPVDDVIGLFGGEVGVVSLPATYANDPIIWASLTHEVCGHDVTHADTGLLEELTAGVATAFAGSPSDPSITRDDLANLWGYWMDEAVADVYGLLNMGPIFATNLAFFFVALNKVGGGTAELRMVSGFDRNDPKRMLDPHPTDILRLHLAIGVIDTLTGLALADRTRYIADLEALAKKLANGATIQLVGNMPSAGGLAPLQVKVPLAYMQQSARNVGGYIASAKLTALNAHGIQDIETWDDGDETRATVVRDALLAGKSIVSQGDDAQLLAGTTLALLQKPDQYDAFTARLNDALDESFATDPFWGMPPKDPIYLRYPKKLSLG